jgi:hypothetical protein
LSPLLFDCVKYVFVEKFPEIFFGDANVDVVIDLDCHTNTIALANAEAAGQHNIVCDAMLSNGILE